MGDLGTVEGMNGGRKDNWVELREMTEIILVLVLMVWGREEGREVVKEGRAGRRAGRQRLGYQTDHALGL